MAASSSPEALLEKREAVLCTSSRTVDLSFAMPIMLLKVQRKGQTAAHECERL